MKNKDTYEEFLRGVTANYSSLSEDEKNTIRGMKGTQEAKVLNKILGNDFSPLNFKDASKPTFKSKRRGLATR
tara:strand:+ start:382 stop:600 length:219 start_codon:yes stop_codon:yes gene_type:complete